MKPEDIISWKQISRMLAGNDSSIRKNRVPDKYKAKVQELLDYTQVWINRQ